YRSCQSIVSFANQFVKSISARMKEEDINAVKNSKGEVKMIKHSGSNMETALVDDLLSVNTDGTTCILTNTNHEALLILGILKQKNIPAKLIQSIDGFDMYDIAEIRYFLKKLSTDSISPVISNEQWNSAVEALREYYCNSACLPIILNILHTFEKTNEKKYRTDFEMFLHESNIEDFYTNEQGVITLSTMHKSKGREFDNVYMLLNNVDMESDEEKRKLYVGMTRAKNLLHIHYFSDVLDKYAEFSTTDEIDLHTYPKPSELILQLSHKDVYLDFFKDKKSLILQLKSGTHLMVRGNRLYIQVNSKLKPVLQFSSKCNENVKQLIASGYFPYDAVIRFICAWKGKEDITESAVILADIYFQ
ncbi:MAG: ATP-binding domain-containing protein, partial [Ruminococcus sp.]|nr:ATP-binding domain-containing protein [Ruminococcus sp.]